MQRERFDQTGGYGKFFRGMMSYNDINNYYTLNFNLMKHHNFSLTEIENMIPYEREIYVSLLIKHLREKEEKNGN